MGQCALLYHGHNEELHPAHRGFADAIGADVVRVADAPPNSIRSFYQEASRGHSIGRYETVIAEGSRPLYTGLLHKARYDSTLVYLCADHRLYQLWNESVEVDSVYSFVKHALGKHGKPLVRTVARRGIDGVIAVSEFVEGYLRPVVSDRVPVRISHPYVQADLYRDLGEVEPDVTQTSAVTVGRGTPYKGVDMLVEAWPAVREQHPDAELHVVGTDHPQSFETIPGVTVHGYVENIADVYADAGLYVQPSRVDPFPVAVLEALRAGLPAVVTETTGSRSEIAKLDENLIAPATPEGLSSAINRYFGLSEQQRASLSNDANARGERFDPETRKRAFRDEFQNLQREIASHA